ncbi:30S ribosomal protein S15 [bacterium]|nr:30S ribosomal protein S15 [bacterium]
MTSTKEEKQKIIQEYQRNPGDTGCPEVQIALLSHRINHLMGHFDQHKKDHHSRTGLLRMVSKRRRLLDYLKSTNLESYQNVITKLGIRK